MSEDDEKDEYEDDFASLNDNKVIVYIDYAISSYFLLWKSLTDHYDLYQLLP